MTVTTAATAVQKFEIHCLNIKSSDGPRAKTFLKEVGKGHVFRDIAITRDDSNVAQFQKVRLNLLDQIGHSTAERFQDLFNDPVTKASSVSV